MMQTCEVMYAFISLIAQSVLCLLFFCCWHCKQIFINRSDLSLFLQCGDRTNIFKRISSSMHHYIFFLSTNKPFFNEKLWLDARCFLLAFKIRLMQEWKCRQKEKCRGAILLKIITIYFERWRNYYITHAFLTYNNFHYIFLMERKNFNEDLIVLIFEYQI